MGVMAMPQLKSKDITADAFRTIEAQIYWGNAEDHMHHCKRHVDSASSMLHMGLTIQGDRELTYEVVDECNSISSKHVALRAGSVYVSSPCFFWHTVTPSTC